MADTISDGFVGAGASAGEVMAASHVEAARAFFAREGGAAGQRGEAGGVQGQERGAVGAHDIGGSAPKGAPIDRDGGARRPEKAAGGEAEEIDRGLQAPPETARARAGWEELKKRAAVERERAAVAERRAAEAEARLNQSPAVAAEEATRARVAELEEQNRSYSDRLKVADVRGHPEFVARFTAPQEEAKAALREIAKSDEAEVDVDALLGLKGKAFNQAASWALESLTPYARVKFQSALDRYLAAEVAGQEAMAKADTFLQTAQQQNGARARAAFDAVASGYRDHFVPIAVDEKASEAEKTAATDYNAALAGVNQAAEGYAFGKIDAQRAAELAHKAAWFEFTMARGLPRLGQLFDAELGRRASRIAELEAQVKAMAAAAPVVAGGAGAGSAAAEVEGDHLRAARRYFGG